jgi:hypothetical protein
MNILRRWLWATKETFTNAAEQTRKKGFEVTVERETITLLVRGQQGKTSEAPTMKAESKAPLQQD